MGTVPIHAYGWYYVSPAYTELFIIPHALFDNENTFFVTRL